MNSPNGNYESDLRPRERVHNGHHDRAFGGESNLRQQPYRREEYQPRERVPEAELGREKVACERKTFAFCLKENHIGRLVRVTEDAGGRYNSIVIPISGLAEIIAALQKLQVISDQIPLPTKHQP